MRAIQVYRYLSYLLEDLLLLGGLLSMDATTMMAETDHTEESKSFRRCLLE
jgi:hypothetical protein